jgi:hypothetical protein
VQLIGRTARHVGPALVVVRPEHLEVDDAPDGPADAGAWRVLGRRFTGSEILLELGAPDGVRVWAEAGPHVRRLRLGDHVTVRLRTVESVAFPTERSATRDQPLPADLLAEDQPIGEVAAEAPTTADSPPQRTVG